MALSDIRRLVLFLVASLAVHALCVSLLKGLWPSPPTLPSAAPPSIEITLLPPTPPAIVPKSVVPPPLPHPVRPVKVTAAKPDPPKPAPVTPEPVQPRPRLRVAKATPKAPSARRNPKPARRPAPAAAPSMAAGPTHQPEKAKSAPPPPASPTQTAQNDRHPELTLPLPSAGSAPDIAPPALPGGEGAGGGQTPGEGKGSSLGSGGRGSGGTGSGGSRQPFGLGSGGTGQGEGPRHIVYVLDVSLSMESRIDRAEKELRDTLAGMTTDESFDIIAFGGVTQPFDTQLEPATKENIAQASRFLDTLRLREGTNLELAMRQAFAVPGVNVVFIITDGLPSVGETDNKKLIRLARELNRPHARVYTVGLVGRNPDGSGDPFEAAKLLQQISRDSGGQSKVVTLGIATPQ